MLLGIWLVLSQLFVSRAGCGKSSVNIGPQDVRTRTWARENTLADRDRISNATSGPFLNLPPRWYYTFDYGSQFPKEVPDVTFGEAGPSPQTVFSDIPR